MITINDTLREARRYSKSIKDRNNFSVKIAVLGSASIQHFVMLLRYKLHNAGIEADIYEGEYNGITMDVFDDNSPLYAFKPDFVILIPHFSDIKNYPAPLSDDILIEELLQSQINYYYQVWKRVSNIENVQIVQSTIVIPPERVLGTLEFTENYSHYNYIDKVNILIRNNKCSNVAVRDLDRISSLYGKIEWFDYSAYFLSKSYCKLEFLEHMVDPFEKYIIAASGKVRKCIVLDLDNTLWGGIVGDLGYDGIQIDPNNAIGEAYRYFQNYLLLLKERGVILAVCSKNDEDNAKEPFEKNVNMILKMNDISCFIANWEDKASNIKRISDELNIGLDSLVFVDDNPAEREIVREFLPEVMVVDIPNDPALYVNALEKCNLFSWIKLTKEDLLRSNSYIENRNREELQAQFVDYEQYLKALEMHGEVKEITETEVSRFAQLLNKSNQFNLRTIRYTEAEINELRKNDGYSCISVKLRDKFSEYGIISCIILRFVNEKCFIESWVMSCRVLKRKVENFAFDYICDVAKENGCSSIIGEYIPSKKNNMVSTFYDSLGFKNLDERDGIKTYEYLLENRRCETFIPITTEEY